MNRLYSTSATRSCSRWAYEDQWGEEEVEREQAEMTGVVFIESARPFKHKKCILEKKVFAANGVWEGWRGVVGGRGVQEW